MRPRLKAISKRDALDVLYNSLSQRNSHLAIITSDTNKPEFKGSEKKFPSKSKTGVFFNDKAKLSTGFDRLSSNVGQIKDPRRPMKFEDFMIQFSSDDDLENLELNSILDIDFEKLEELKEKAIEFIDATAYALLEMSKKGECEGGDDELVLFFNEKLQELKTNDIHLQIFIENLDKVSGIGYEKNGARIYYKNK